MITPYFTEFCCVYQDRRDAIKLLSEEKWLAPEYYGDFHCKGGNCRYSCCQGWRITLSRTEYYRLIGMECSKELHAKIECALHVVEDPTPERYAMISPNWLGDCPMHDEGGLCMLHKECGEEALPDVCRLYPRSLRESCHMHSCVCSSSCEAVVEMLMEKEAPLRFVALDMRAHSMLHPQQSDVQMGKMQEAIKELQDRSMPLGERIGRLCADESAKKMTEPQAFGTIMEMIARFAQFSRALEMFGESALRRYETGDDAAYACYCEDAARMEERERNWARTMEQVLVNHLFYAEFPAVDERVHEKTAHRALAGLYGVLRVVCAAYLTEHDEETAFCDVIAGVFRFVEHTAFYLNAGHMLQNADLSALVML